MGEILYHYAEIMTDPAHLMAEVSLMLLVDVLFLGLVWPLVRSAIKREHHNNHEATKEAEMSDHPRIDELLATHSGEPEYGAYVEPEPYHCVVPQRKVQQNFAVLDGDEPAKGWYLPLAGKEHITYETRQEASAAAVRLCVQLGLPVVMPLSKGSAVTPLSKEPA